MSLVAVACPQTESELACMLCELEAHGIPVFVQGAGFGSLWPGVQIPWYNARRIRVSGVDVPEAQVALAVFQRPAHLPTANQWPGVFHLLRMVAEIGLGWCVPGGRRQPRDHI